MGTTDKTDATNSNELQVTLMDIEKMLFKGVARSVSSVNDKGTFDILPLHSNFITLIKQKVDIQDRAGKHQSFPISNGVLICKQNEVKIYLGI